MNSFLSLLKIKLLVLFFFVSLLSFSQEKLINELNLMPWPQEIVENQQAFIIKPDFSIGIETLDNKRINTATKSFLRRLSDKTGSFFIEEKAHLVSKNQKSSLLIKFERKGSLKLHEDESYRLEITEYFIKLEATTDIGILRGLETLLQLVLNGENAYYFDGVVIKDQPRFPWRGLMIDVSRHFEPLDIIKRNLDAMAAVKLNVFHWHLTDDQGFRVEVKSYPKFQELASKGLFYTQEEIIDLVQYADNLGIRVVPEFDIPAHATAWLVAYPEIGSKENESYTIEINAGIFNPTLDPTNKKTYEIIDAVFTEMSALFPDSYFHIGGDENAGKHWNENKKIQAFMKENHFDSNHNLQTYFNIKIQKILQKNNKIMMGWDEIFQPDLPKDVVIHSWRGNKSMLKAAKMGYQTVLSQGYYIDLMLPASKHYLNDPLKINNGLTLEESKNILGGEATMWGELVTPLTIDSRIWPRTAAIAERLWSQQSIADVNNMYKRLEIISFQLESLGITHIKNKEVILRNITDNQDITALKDLMNVCEPLKGYTRNHQGTEYKSFSPFTLFADACTADAPDALKFNNNTNLFIKKQEATALKMIKRDLAKWSGNYSKLSKIRVNTKIQPLIPLSKNLSEISTQILASFNQKRITKERINLIKKLLIELNKPYADVDLMLVNSFKELLSHCEKEFLIAGR